MPPKSAPITQAAICRMIKDGVDAAIVAERTRQENVKNDASGSGIVRSQDATPVVHECTFSGFMKCNLAVFRGVEGDVKLRRWFEKTESIFEINICTEGKKVMFVAATLEGPALTWWKTKVATMGLETVNQMPWTKMKQLMTKEFCLIEEVQRMDHELWNMKVRNKERYCKEKCVATRANAQPIWTCYDYGEQGHTRNRCPKKVKQVEVGEVHVRAYAINAEPQVPYVVTGTFLLNNRYAFVLYDSGSNRSFMDTRFSAILDIDPIKIGASYEVELDDGRVASTNNILKGFTLNLVNHIIEIDVMSIELATFDVIIGMDWFAKHDAVIVCGEKVVRIPYGNKMLIVESDKGKRSQRGDQGACLVLGCLIGNVIEVLEVLKVLGCLKVCQNRKLKCVCHWANPFKDLKWSNVPGVKLSLFSKSDNTLLRLQALSDLHYLFNGFMDYLWSRELNISNFGPADRRSTLWTIKCLKWCCLNTGMVTEVYMM
nr:reverse transcriptase domain-containing protein [Tanacetum cinerariifolium]